MARMVLGIFSDRPMAEEAISRLEEQGFNPRDISIIMRDQQTKQVASSTGSNIGTGAATGATTGGVVGALTGLLAGIGAITIPGIGALLIGGPVAAALGLTGAAATTLTGAVTGIVAGGIIGGLIGLGVPEEEAKVYEARIREGGILLAVPVDNISEVDALDVMEDCGADQIRAFGFSDIQRTDEMSQIPAYYHDLRRSKKRS